jgi:hypothetical protein
MSNGSGRHMFAGHAIGAAARFHRLYETQNLNHIVPTLGSSVVPVSGGRSDAHCDPYSYEVDSPQKCCLLSVQRVDTLADGRDTNGVIETEVSAEVVGLSLVGKLRCDLVRMHMLTSRTGTGPATVTTNGNRIDGLRLGNVQAIVTIDEEPLVNACDSDRFCGYHATACRPISKFGAYHKSTIVREIQLVGSEKDKQGMSVDGNVIVWKGFGRIILGEIHVKAHDRRLTLVRLEMGSDAGGSGSAGDGHSNGETGG